MNIQALHHRGRDERQTSSLQLKRNYVLGRLLATDAFSAAFIRKINRDLFQKIERGWPLVDGHAWHLADADTHVRQGGHLRSREKIETVIFVVFVDEHLGTLFGRYRLLNRIREDLAERKVRSNIYVRGGGETVGKIVNAFDVEARAALVRMCGVGFRSQDAILDIEKSEVEKRARVCTRAHVRSKAEAALRVNVAAERHVNRATQRLEVSVRKSKPFSVRAFTSRAAERRRQKTRSTITMLDRYRNIWEIENRDSFQTKAGGDHARSVSGFDLCPLGMKAPLGSLFIAGGDLG